MKNRTPRKRSRVTDGVTACHSLDTKMRARSALVAASGSSCRLAGSLLLLSSLAMAQDWTSKLGSALNDSRATGVKAHGDWVQVWSVPSTHGYDTFGALVKDGVAYFRGAGTGQHVAVDIATGNQNWTMTAATSYGDFYRPGCILGDRLFISAGNMGTGALDDTERVQAVDLATGASIWVWDSGTKGMSSALQALPASLTGLSEDVVALCTAKGVAWEEFRAVKLDANAVNAGSALLQQQPPTSGQRYISYNPISGWMRPSAGYSMYVHQYLFASGNWHTREIKSIGLASLTAPFPANLQSTNPNAAGGVGSSAVVVDDATGTGFVFDTNGDVMSIDLDTMTANWTAPSVSSVSWLQVFALENVLIVPDRYATNSTVTGLDRATGATLWTIDVDSGTLPSIVSRDGGIVLDDNLLLMPFLNGDLRTIDENGAVSGPLATVPGAKVVRAWQDHFLVQTDTAMIAFRAEAPGVAYCFGIGCPCANDDFNAGCANSTNAGSHLEGTGSASLGAANLSLTATGVPPNKAGIVFMGTNNGLFPFGDGLRCAVGAIVRFNVSNSGATGTITEGPNLLASAGLVPGNTRTFQCWYRDPLGPCSGQFNTSNAYSIEVTP